MNDKVGDKVENQKLISVVDRTQGPNSLRSIEARRLQAAAGKHIAGWKPEPPKPGTDLSLPKSERALKVIAKIDSAYPNVNPTQLSELIGQNILKGSTPDFWFASDTRNALFDTITARLRPNSDLPKLVTMHPAPDVNLTKNQVIAQFGKSAPLEPTAKAKGDSKTEGLRYLRTWGILAVIVNKADGKINTVVFFYK